MQKKVTLYTSTSKAAVNNKYKFYKRFAYQPEMSARNDYHFRLHAYE